MLLLQLVILSCAPLYSFMYGIARIVDNCALAQQGSLKGRLGYLMMHHSDRSPCVQPYFKNQAQVFAHELEYLAPHLSSFRTHETLVGVPIHEHTVSSTEDQWPPECNWSWGLELAMKYHSFLGNSMDLMVIYGDLMGFQGILPEFWDEHSEIPRSSCCFHMGFHGFGRWLPRPGQWTPRIFGLSWNECLP